MFINAEAQRQIVAVIAKPAGLSSSAETQQRASALLELNPGQQVKAQIIANLPNSLYLARIAGEIYQLDIPLNVQPGQLMDLTFVTADPRLTFSVVPPDGGVLSVRLSSLGRWLATVLQETPSLTSAQEPLLDSPQQGAALLAARLAASVSQSGLFYEAHLARWAAGGLPLTGLLREPQGKLSGTASGADEAAGKESDEPIFADDRTLPLVKEQLQLLDTGRFFWKGEAWPGQGIEISVSGEEDEPEQRIEASVALELPRVGAVEAKLSLAPDGVSLEIVCGREESVTLLKEGGERLRLALSSCGLQLRRLSVRDGQAEG